MEGSIIDPFVVGQWVRGERFYGRESEISEILEGPREAVWVLGARSIGKTSLLKQLELLTSQAPERGFFPVFWDLQGTEDSQELQVYLEDSLLDSEERLAAVGIDLSLPEAGDTFASLGRLRRRLRERGLKLLLLCDEVDQLGTLQRSDPSLLRKLQREILAREDVRSVLASTVRLWTLAVHSEDTSPFLLGLTPPLYLRALTEAEAGALIRQDNLQVDARPAINEEVAAQIRLRCNNHPFLIQLLCKRYLEAGDLVQAVEQLAHDHMVSNSFAADIELLPETDRRILGLMGERGAASRETLLGEGGFEPGGLRDGLLRLENLGFIGREPEGQFVLINEFFRWWLAGLKTDEPPLTGGLTSTSAERITEIVSELSQIDGPRGSPEALLPLVYDDLRQLASRYMRRERPDHTLQPTAVVHEAYLKLVDQSRVNWQGRTHFFAVGAQAMRRILIDHARRRRRVKRGGEQLRVTLAEELLPSRSRELGAEELLALNRALEKLADVDPRQARIVELRFFAGLTTAEVANVLGVSNRTVEGDWARAREWLREEMAE
jgi:RNA polymerase sigma-70 factor (ECF subfamily)